MVEPLIIGAAGAAGGVALIRTFDEITDWWRRTHGKDPWGRPMSQIRARDIEVGHFLIAYQDGNQLAYVDQGPKVTRREPGPLGDDGAPTVRLDTKDYGSRSQEEKVFVLGLDNLVAVSS